MRSALGWISGTTLIVVISVASLGLGDADGLAASHAIAAPQDAPEFSRNPNYKHAWIDVDGVKTHYIEAGSGPPFVLVHGALSWESGEVNYSDVMGPSQQELPCDRARHDRVRLHQASRPARLHGPGAG